MPKDLAATEGTLLENNNWWYESRKLLRSVFQGYIQDFGEDAGMKIISTIIEVLGNCRICVPVRLGSGDNSRELEILYDCLCERFGNASGEAIMRRFILELKGHRISFPDHQDLWREERNRKIRAKFNGGNYQELAINFGMDVSMVWKIVNGDDERIRRT